MNLLTLEALLLSLFARMSCFYWLCSLSALIAVSSLYSKCLWPPKLRHPVI